jgi:hypothetical protein
MSSVNDASLTIATFAPVLQEVAHIPLWIFQGGIDTNPTPAKTRNSVKKFKDAGMSVRYNEYSNLGHGTWNTAYNEPDFFTWILSKNKSTIHTYGGVAAICLSNGQGVKLELARGFKAYQWEYNGVVISGATAATYTANTPGVYRARFSRLSSNPTEAQWNMWSDPVTVTESDPAQAQVIQKGSVVLKDLNNYGNAHLSAVGDFAHYYWYKDGILLDLPGSQDDTTKNPIFKSGTCTTTSCPGNGVYTLVTAGFDNCPSPVSAPFQVYFNNLAPVNMTAPATFTGSSTSPSQATLNWVDASSNESGFEIWRRKNTGPGTYSKWFMAALTAANVNTFNDTGLEPSSLYQYKIRAVGAGRSNYTPSASNQYLVINTQVDITAPSTPQNLTATATGLREITLSWEASSDDTAIKHYLIFFDDDTVQTTGATTTQKLNNLTLNHDFEFTVKAVDLGNNLSDASGAASASTYMTGLYYEHSTGSWTDLDQINWNIAEYRGQVTNFTLTPRTQEDYFNFEFDGYLYINIAGVYQFRTTSDDGSRLALNSTVIVENDGLHGDVTITSADQNLTSGPQLINVKYFEATGGNTLTVRYRGPDTGNNWVVIPNAALKSGDQPMGLAARLASPPETEVKKDSPKMKTANIYPNPIRSMEGLTVTAEEREEAPVHITLVNMMGEVFYERTFEAEDLTNGAFVQPSKYLTKGVYIMVIHNGESVVKQRIIVRE